MSNNPKQPPKRKPSFSGGTSGPQKPKLNKSLSSTSLVPQAKAAKGNTQAPKSILKQPKQAAAVAAAAAAAASQMPRIDSQSQRETSIPLSENQDGVDDEKKMEGVEGAADKEKQLADEQAEESDEEAKDLVDIDWQATAGRSKEDMKVLLEAFSPEQQQRYEAYRRSKLDKTNVKRLVSQVLNQQCSQTMAFVVAGFAKVFVGEIVEKAREVMEDWNETGPIRPDHLREALRRYKHDTGLPAHQYQKKLFIR